MRARWGWPCACDGPHAPQLGLAMCVCSDSSHAPQRTLSRAGSNMYGQLGTSGIYSSLIPVDAASGRKYTSLVSGHYHTCGLKADRAVECWGAFLPALWSCAWLWSLTQPYPSMFAGWNDSGQLGDGTFNSSSSPVASAPGRTYASIAAGAWYTCGLKAVGTVECWGAAFFGRPAAAPRSCVVLHAQRTFVECRAEQVWAAGRRHHH